MPLGALALLTFGAADCRRGADHAAVVDAGGAKAGVGTRLEAPYPIDPFSAVDLDGRDVSFSTWKGRVVIVNVWATWCAPCRREIPALAAMQDTYRGRLLVIGLLQDNVTTDFAKQFSKVAGLNYPVVRSTFDIERRFPAVLLLPMTFIVDTTGRMTTMYSGEIDPAQVEREIVTLLPG